MAPNLTPEQIDELESRGLLSSGISQSMRKYSEERAANVEAKRAQMMQELGATPKPVLDKVLTDLSQSREQDDAYAIPAKIAMDAARNPELGDIVERTNEKLQEIKGGRVQMSPTGAGNVALNVPMASRQVEMLPGEQAPVGDGVPAPVERISNPAVLPPPAQEGVATQEAPGPNLGQMQLDALDMKGQAAMMRAGDEQRAGNAKAAFIERTAADLQAAEDARLLQRAELERKRNDQLAKVEQAQAKYDTMQIDPNHFYGTRTTEQNILLNLGLALSVFGGNTKEYTDNIYKAIDRDIDLQKEQINLQGSKVTGARNVLSDMMAVTKDVDTAAEMARAGMLKQAELKGAAMAARVSNADAKAKLLDTVADLQMKRAEIMSKMTSTDSIDQQLAMSQLSKGVSVLDDKGFSALTKSIDKKELPALVVPGVGVAATKEDANDVKTAKVAYQNMTAGLKRLEDLRSKQGKFESILPSQIRQQGVSIARELLNQYRVIAKLGTLDVQSQAMFDDILSKDPLGVSLSPGDLASYGIRRIEGDPFNTMVSAFKESTRQGYASILDSKMRAVNAKTDAEVLARNKGADLRSKLKEVETPKALK